MTRQPGTSPLLIHRHDGGRLHRLPDDVAVEEPLEIRLDGRTVATTLRTPGHDAELAVGLLHAEHALDGCPAIKVRHSLAATEDHYLNIVSVDTGGLATPPAARLNMATASCGLCGSTSIADMTSRLTPLQPTPLPPPDVLLAVGRKVSAHQGLFGSTGGVHAAALFDAAGQPTLIREDVGRHNAVDKVVGRLRLDGRLPAAGLGLFVSGRAGFELVHKAWAAGFAWMVAVGAPTSLSVETARAAQLALVGFATDDHFNVYAPLDP